MEVTHVPHNKLDLRIGGQLRTYNRGLTNEELQIAVPSVFQVQSHESRSSRFAPISTIKVIDALREEGFVPCFAMQSKARSEDRQDYTKHMIRLRPADYDYRTDWNEIILVNANDGSSSYQLTPGRFRLVCSNGLVLGSQQQTHVVYHKGQTVERDVIEGTFEVVKEFAETDRFRKEMEQMLLSDQQRKNLAMISLVMATGGTSDFPFQPQQLLKPRRYEDSRTDVWTTFNTIQENLIKGGISYINATSGRNTRSREIKNIARNMEVNRAAWSAAKMLIEDVQTVQSA